jgi:hypothetical protein
VKLKSAFRSVRSSAAAKCRSRRPSRAFESLEPRQMLTITFLFDYSMDTSNFFNTQTKRNALLYAAHSLADVLGDGLDAIKPSGGNTWSLTVTNPSTNAKKTFNNPSLAENIIKVFVGARDISSVGLTTSAAYSSSGSSAWNTLVKTRGETGATGSTLTDYAPKYASIAFDNADTKWHFGKTTNGLDDDEVDFISVAMHELGHVLGFSTANGAWTRLISGGTFNGPKTKAANNNRGVPVSSDNKHFKDGASFEGLELAMDPVIEDGTRKFFSKIEFSAMDDFGWTISGRDESIYEAKHHLTHLIDPDSELSTEDSFVLNGAMNDAKDVDFFRVFAEEGSTLRASVSPASGFDTYLKLYDSAGTPVRTGDQGDQGQKDSVTYTFTRSDYFYVAVSSYGNHNYDPFKGGSGVNGPTGNYRLVVTVGDSGPNVKANSVASGSLTKTGSASLILTSGNSTINAGSIAGTQAVIAQPATLSTSSFTVTGAANLRFTHATSTGSNPTLSGITSPPVDASTPPNPLAGDQSAGSSQVTSDPLNCELVDEVIDVA